MCQKWFWIPLKIFYGHIRNNFLFCIFGCFRPFSTLFGFILLYFCISRCFRPFSTLFGHHTKNVFYARNIFSSHFYFCHFWMFYAVLNTFHHPGQKKKIAYVFRIFFLLYFCISGCFQSFSTLFRHHVKKPKFARKTL